MNYKIPINTLVRYNLCIRSRDLYDVYTNVNWYILEETIVDHSTDYLYFVLPLVSEISYVQVDIRSVMPMWRPNGPLATVGHKGVGSIQTGLMYAPYVPLLTIKLRTP